MNNNMKLYFEGLWANIIICIGTVILAVGISGFFLSFLFGIITGSIGSIIIIYGRAKRFDYKLRSGHIIHRGD